MVARLNASTCGGAARPAARKPLSKHHDGCLGEKLQSHHVFDLRNWELSTIKNSIPSSVSVPKIWSGSWGKSLDVSVWYRAVRTRPCSATAGPGSSKPSDFNSFHGSKDSEQYWSHLQTSIANFRSKLSWAIDWISYHSIPFRIGCSNAVNPWSAWTLDYWTNTWDSKLANCVSETVLWTQELPSQNCRKWNRKPSKWIQQALHYMLRFRLQKDVLRFFYNIENIQEQSFSPPVKWIVVVATMWLLWRIPSDWVDALTLDRPGKVSRKARQHNLRRHRPNVAWKHMSNGADEDTDLEDSRISTRWQHAILQFVMFHHTLQIFNLMLLGTLGRLLAEHTEMIMPGAPRCHGQNQSSPLPLRCPMPLTQSPMALT